MPSAGEPVITPDPMSEEEWLASVEATAAEDEPWWLGEDDADPGEDVDWAEVEAYASQAAADQARADAEAARLGATAALGALAAASGRRGPGQPGSAQSFPGGA